MRGITTANHCNFICSPATGFLAQIAELQIKKALLLPLLQLQQLSQIKMRLPLPPQQKHGHLREQLRRDSKKTSAPQAPQQQRE